MATIKKGNTWQPDLNVTVESTGAAFNCTDYTVKMYIKKTLSESEAALQTLDVVWDDRSNGIGHFLLTNAMSKALQVGTYYYAVIIYKTSDQSLVKTLDQDTLVIEETLEKDFT